MLGGNDAIAVLDASSEFQLLQLPPQVLPFLILLPFPEGETEFYPILFADSTTA